MSRWPTLLLSLTLLSGPAHAHDAPHNQRLPTIGPAPDFTLTSQDPTPVSLHDLRSANNCGGKVEMSALAQS
ncbi:putative transcriptional regulator [Rhizobium tibeticum]|uniref:hypothetical protein n=1 Tax=Rhizobium tibeticum TaxID=501024 RepID=UPI002780C948|nr:hypothetical protein [Rhizobium tibeticum]MDP9808091.1 putative transcriptional regulator [Rhizobium tibeticum]